MATEAWFMYQHGVPSVSGPVSPEKGTNGAFCSAGEVCCLAPEWAMVNYVEKQFSAKNPKIIPVFHAETSRRRSRQHAWAFRA
jgi:hypothetical protein